MIIVVSGLPRSGTSLMMQMLQAGGIPLLTDNQRKPDPNNPKGYWEFEKVKKLKKDSSWLKKAKGKAVKIISAFLPYLPPQHRYQIIFMERKMEEILASQRKMMERRGKKANPNEDKKLALLFKKHLKEIKLWLAKQENIEVVYINYNKLLNDPTPVIKKISQFLKIKLNTQAMKEAIDPTLYRNRK
jgi:hypothetical protein